MSRGSRSAHGKGPTHSCPVFIVRERRTLNFKLPAWPPSSRVDGAETRLCQPESSNDTPPPPPEPLGFGRLGVLTGAGFGAGVGVTVWVRIGVEGA
jgi:hypothetical protein